MTDSPAGGLGYAISRQAPAFPKECQPRSSPDLSASPLPHSSRCQASGIDSSGPAAQAQLWKAGPRFIFSKSTEAGPWPSEVTAWEASLALCPPRKAIFGARQLPADTEHRTHPEELPWPTLPSRGVVTRLFIWLSIHSAHLFIQQVFLTPPSPQYKEASTLRYTLGMHPYVGM